MEEKETEKRTRMTHRNMPRLYLTKVQKQFSGETIAISTNDMRVNGHHRGEKRKRGMPPKPHTLYKKSNTKTKTKK